MRIALVDNGLTVGGTLTMTANISRGLYLRGHEVFAIISVSPTIAAPYFGGTAELIELTIPYNYLRSASLKRTFGNVPLIGPISRPIGLLLDEALHPINAIYGVQLARRLVQLQPDVIHMANGSVAITAIAKLKKPIVFHLHGLLRADMKPQEIAMLSVVDRFIAISKCVADSYATIGLDPKKISTICNFVLPRSTLLSRGEAKQRLEVPDDGDLITFVGRLVPWKGVLQFIAAMQLIAQIRPNARFLIVGDPSEAPDYARMCREIIRSLSCSSRFHFINHLSDPYVAYRAASVFVHASIEAEPFGMVLLEAMQAGTPVVAADLGGPQEIIEHGVSGLLVNPNEAHAVASAVLEVVDDCPKRFRMIEAASHRVETAFSVERAIEQLEDVYQTVLATRSGTSQSIS